MATSAIDPEETPFSQGPIDPHIDVGPESLIIRRPRSREHSENFYKQGDFPTEGPIIFWSYLILIIATIIGSSLIIKDHLKNLWIDQVNRTIFPPGGVLLLLFVLSLILVLYGSYHGHISAPTSGYRYRLIIVFVIEMILLVIWSVFFFKLRGLRNSAFVAILIMVLTFWWIWILWPLNRGAGISLLVYLAWWVYLGIASWDLSRKDNS